VYHSQAGQPQRHASTRTVASGSLEEELKNPYEDDDNLQNPYDLYGAGGVTARSPTATGSVGPGYGSSPYHGLTRDVAGLDIGGGGGSGKQGQQGRGYGQPIVGQ